LGKNFGVTRKKNLFKQAWKIFFSANDPANGVPWPRQLGGDLYRLGTKGTRKPKERRFAQKGGKEEKKGGVRVGFEKSMAIQ